MTTAALDSEEAWPWAAILIDFLSAGYSEDLYWSLTPRQVEAHFAAARRRFRLERNTMMETAYLAAIVPHQKKPTKLERLLVPLDDPKPKVPQSVDEMLSIARQWTAAVNRNANGR